MAKVLLEMEEYQDLSAKAQGFDVLVENLHLAVCYSNIAYSVQDVVENGVVAIQRMRAAENAMPEIPQ